MTQPTSLTPASKIATAISDLLTRKATHEAALGKIVQELADLEVAARVMRTYGFDVPDVNTLEHATPMRAVALKQLDRTVTKRERILTVAVEMLKSGPLLTDRLLDELGKRDVAVSGDDRKAQIRNLSSYLSRAQTELGIEATRAGWTAIRPKSESLNAENGNSQHEAFNVQPVPEEGRNS